MASTLDKFRQDLEKLIRIGRDLLSDFIGYEKEKDKPIQGSEKFNSGYQKWYSESYEVIRQILPNRLGEFETLYKGDKRKKIDSATYTIQDWLLGIRSPINEVTREKWFEDFNATVMRFQNQLHILESARSRFESTLFDIQQIVRADLFDSELDSARDLLKNKFLRAAGAVAGVVLEKHLEQVCINHKVPITKKDPNISYYNDSLKKETVADIPTWRFIQRLGDLRNLCDHNKKREPTKEEVNDLIEGTDKITKTLF